MKLYEYRKKISKSRDVCAIEIAAIVGAPITSMTIWRWEKGIHTPAKDFMRGIFTWSNGAVQPNDFYLTADADES